jgi:hypothetical protein
MTGKNRHILHMITTMALVILLAAGISACSSGGDNARQWQDDPIVPGYSMAEVNIADPFSAVQAIHGDPAENRREGGYIYVYYYRLQEEGELDDPGTWNLVVTLYDNGNDYLDPEDEVGAIEVFPPYSGQTSGENGLGSSAGDLEEEFGPCESISESTGPNNERLQLYSYIDRGVEWLLSRRDGVVTVLVTAYGGLRPVEDADDGDEAQGGLFGIFEAAPIVPGQTVAGINIEDDFITVEEKYGSPDSTGFTTEGLVYATYTGGYGAWKLNVYLEDKDQNNSLGDFDTVVSVGVRSPYVGTTAGGVGIGSPQSAITKEFGAPERESIMSHLGEEAKILEYNTRGIVFAVKATSGEVVEIDVNRSLGT